MFEECSFWTKNDQKKIDEKNSFERFKLETGFDDVQFIDWKLVDQKKKFQKYDKALINSDIEL